MKNKSFGDGSASIEAMKVNRYVRQITLGLWLMCVLIFFIILLVAPWWIKILGLIAGAFLVHAAFSDSRKMNRRDEDYQKKRSSKNISPRLIAIAIFLLIGLGLTVFLLPVENSLPTSSKAGLPPIDPAPLKPNDVRAGRVSPEQLDLIARQAFLTGYNPLVSRLNTLNSLRDSANGIVPIDFRQNLINNLSTACSSTVSFQDVVTNRLNGLPPDQVEEFRNLYGGLLLECKQINAIVEIVGLRDWAEASTHEEFVNVLSGLVTIDQQVRTLAAAIDIVDLPALVVPDGSGLVETYLRLVRYKQGEVQPQTVAPTVLPVAPTATGVAAAVVVAATPVPVTTQQIATNPLPLPATLVLTRSMIFTTTPPAQGMGNAQATPTSVTTSSKSVEELVANSYLINHYSALKVKPPEIKKGPQVSKGDIIAWLGCGGYPEICWGSPHLHFMIYYKPNHGLNWLTGNNPGILETTGEDDGSMSYTLQRLWDGIAGQLDDEERISIELPGGSDDPLLYLEPREVLQSNGLPEDGGFEVVQKTMGSGNFIWPIDSPLVTQIFGKTTTSYQKNYDKHVDPLTKLLGEFASQKEWHDGLDIRNAFQHELEEIALAEGYVDQDARERRIMELFEEYDIRIPIYSPINGKLVQVDIPTTSGSIIPYKELVIEDDVFLIRLVHIRTTE
jgi:hypothetical protein